MKMKCENTEKWFDAYLDGELPQHKIHELEQHLSTCPRCAELLAERRNLQMAWAAQLPRFTAPAGLRERIERSLRESAPEPVKEPRFRRRSFFFTGVAAAAALLIFGLFLLLPDRERDLTQEAAKLFARAQSTDQLKDVNSSDAATVQAFFRQNLEFVTPAVSAAQSGYRLQGGRIEQFDRQRVATVVYGDKQKIVNVLIWPNGGAQLRNTDRLVAGLSVCTWSHQTWNFVAVGNLTAHEMDGFEDEYRDQLR